MKVIFWGTPELAVPSLQAIRNAGHEVLAVVTQPDKEKGRARRISFSPVKDLAVRESIPVFQPQNPNAKTFAPKLAALAPDVMVVVGYGKILSSKLLDIGVPCGWINVHFSLLPRHRGASPVSAAILAGEKETGVSIMNIVREMDAGPVLAARAEAISPEDTTETLTCRLAGAGADLLVRVLADLPDGKLAPRPQDEGNATYCRILRKEDGLMDWSADARFLERFIRAMTPWPTAHTFLLQQGEAPLRLIFRAAEALDERPQSPPGTVARVSEAGMDVAAGQGSLRVKTLQKAGKSALSVAEFLRGTKIRPGDRFGSDSLPDKG